MRVLPVGPHAVLVDDVDDPAAWADTFRRSTPAGVVDVVPAARTVLIVTQDEASLTAVRSFVDEVEAIDAVPDSAEPVTIEVVYDGPDLPDVATATGLSIDEVVELHTASSYRVDFCGFAPGFAYLSGLPEQLRLPRRSSPRTRVPAGSVAIADRYAAVYPTVSPGGWHLLGSTVVALFDVAREQPAMLTPGTTVRFVPA